MISPIEHDETRVGRNIPVSFRQTYDLINSQSATEFRLAVTFPCRFVKSMISPIEHDETRVDRNIPVSFH